MTMIENAPVGKPIVKPFEDAQQQARDLLSGAVERPATKDHTSPSLERAVDTPIQIRLISTALRENAQR